MSTVRRILVYLRDGALARHDLVDEVKSDPGVADDGLLAMTVIGPLVTGLFTLHWLPAVLAIVLAPLFSLFAAFVLRLVCRIASTDVTLAQTTATVTLTSLPLVLVPIPLIGLPLAVTWWLLAGILVLQRVTLARLDNAAVVTLLSHALTVGAVLGAGFAVQALI